MMAEWHNRYRFAFGWPRCRILRLGSRWLIDFWPLHAYRIGDRWMVKAWRLRLYGINGYLALDMVP